MDMGAGAVGVDIRRWRLLKQAAAAGRVNLRAIITGRFALEDTEAALRAGREDPASIKPLVVPGAPVSADS